MTHRQIRLLGSFQVTVDGEAVTQFGSDSARALLAYLALHPGTPLRRDALAGLLWPEYADAEARRNLRVALSRLRTAIGDQATGDPLLQVSRQEIQFSQDAAHLVDAGAMREALATTRAHAHERLEECAECAALLLKATALYRGELLAGFDADWIQLRRLKLRREYVELLRAIGDLSVRLGHLTQALDAFRSALLEEPFEERIHLAVMELYARQGRRDLVRRQFVRMQELLLDELNVEPLEETRGRYYQLMR